MDQEVKDNLNIRIAELHADIASDERRILSLQATRADIDGSITKLQQANIARLAIIAKFELAVAAPLVK